METSQPLTSAESFSHNWLINRRVSFGLFSDDDDDEAEESYIVKSKRFLEEAHNFNFDFPIISTSDITTSTEHPFVHSDELFIDGPLMPPKHNSTTRAKPECESSPTSLTPNNASFSSKRRRRLTCHFLVKWQKSTKRVLQKCWRSILPRKSIRVVDMDMSTRSELGRSEGNYKSWNNTPQESPLYVPSNYSHSDAVYEAVLHCKRSFSHEK